MATSVSDHPAAPPPPTKHEGSDVVAGALVIGGVGAAALAAWLLLHRRSSFTQGTAPPGTPPPAACPVAAGTLVQPQGSGAVFLVDTNCQAHGIASVWALWRCGYGGAPVQQIPPAVLGLIPGGAPIGTPGSCCPPGPSGSSRFPPGTYSGAFVTAPGSPEVFYIDGNAYKHAVANEAAFLACGGRPWGSGGPTAVHAIDAGELAGFPLGRQINSAADCGVTDGPFPLSPTC